MTMGYDRITDKIAALPPETYFFSLEFFPPKTQEGFNNLLPRLQRLRTLRPLFTTVTWGAGGSTATKSLELASLTQGQLGLTTCLHLTCTNMRQQVLDDALQRCKEIGVRNILALRGDEPREGEYDIAGVINGNGIANQNRHSNGEAHQDEEVVFKHAVDLVRYIRRKHGSYFCVGAAAYPEGHSTSCYDPSQSAESDVPFLIEKVRAGADFLMTQLFYDVEAFLNFEKMLRDDESAVFKDIVIIPGLMPVQSWSILTRTTKLACAKIPEDMMATFESGKGDDEKVKQLGVEALTSIIERIRTSASSYPSGRKRIRGFHFYTLNLEKAVAQILERCELVRKPGFTEDAEGDTAILSEDEESTPRDNSTTEHRANGSAAAPAKHLLRDRRRLSSRNSAPRNRVVVAHDRTISQSHPAYEALDDEAGVPREKNQSRATALAIAEGEGSLGREATWDDYPNGRWGDARSPAYGSIDGYGPNLHVPASEALRLWSYPSTTAQIGTIFQRYLTGSLSAIPWSEEALSSETALIRKQLLALNERGCWTVASQPAVNAARSDDPIVGWGPKVGGWVWQKPFVEFFISSPAWAELQEKLVAAGEENVAFFAGNAAGEFQASDPESVNPVTWGAFKGKEIITPTLITALSFRAWRGEAFALWSEWQRLYPVGSLSSELLGSLKDDLWLVNVIGHGYLDNGEGFWALLGVGS